MGAYAELAREGGRGPETSALLSRLVAEVAGHRELLAPHGRAHWDDAAVHQVVEELLTPGATGFLLAAWARSHDEASLTAVLRDGVDGLLLSASTRWTAADLQERVLPGADGITRDTEPSGVHWWRLVEGPAPRWSGTDAERVRVRDALQGVPLPERAPTGRPAVTVPVLRTLARTVLGVAGAVRTVDLAELLQERLAERSGPRQRPLMVGSFGDGAPTTLLDGPERTVEVRDTAEALWSTLTVLERALVPHLGRGLDELAAVLGLPAAAAEVAADGLVQRLREAGRDDDRAAEVLVRLRELCTERP